jgi:hypothetical protein
MKALRAVGWLFGWALVFGALYVLAFPVYRAAVLAVAELLIRPLAIVSLAPHEAGLVVASPQASAPMGVPYDLFSIGLNVVFAPALVLALMPLSFGALARALGAVGIMIALHGLQVGSIVAYYVAHPDNTLFALGLSSQAVAGVEVSAAAVELARANAAMNGLTRVRFLAGDAARIFADVRFDPAAAAVVLDPPRKGCDPAFLDQLVAFGPSRVVYVSCDPATQARDVRILAEAGYRPVRVRPFDLFPQTRHIECVATLVRTTA